MGSNSGRAKSNPLLSSNLRVRLAASAPHAADASRAIYESVLETVRAGVATSDLGGHASTTEFVDAVIDKVRSKLDVWATLHG